MGVGLIRTNESQRQRTPSSTGHEQAKRSGSALWHGKKYRKIGELRTGDGRCSFSESHEGFEKFEP